MILDWNFFTIILSIDTVICFISTIVLAIKKNKDFSWSLLCLIAFALATFFSEENAKCLEKKQESKYITISTTTLPQMDTTITYSVGKADTIYTYHFIKED